MEHIQDRIKNIPLFKQAVTLSHKGKPASYERLEFLGDRVLGLVIAELLYKHFPNEKEGDLAGRLAALVKEETLAGIAEKIGLPSFIVTNEKELKKNPSVLADVCEAILGAIYLDAGIDAVKEFIEPLWMPLMDAQLEAPKDSKSALQEWAQGRKYILPVYKQLKREGSDHAPIFTIEVGVGPYRAIGIGSSKKIAEQEAAQNLLKELKSL
ncbi:MAG: ribonuclease III [Lactobacillales bacterium]|nr:ribonuclease III [Lactobacillales bacterium]